MPNDHYGGRIAIVAAYLLLVYLINIRPYITLDIIIQTVIRMYRQRCEHVRNDEAKSGVRNHLIQVSNLSYSNRD